MANTGGMTEELTCGPHLAHIFDEFQSRVIEQQV
jgi:DNA-directed RNA polymerase subunit N (RpoN/RPB10)